VLEDVNVDRSRQYPLGDVSDELDNVLRLRLAAQGQPVVQQRNRHRRLGRDWAVALEAVQQASENMSAAEQRARDIEARGVALAERALKELKEAESRIQIVEEALRVAETRANEAEARAQEAEEWLARLHEAINDRLLVRPNSGSASHAA
jgi:predicted ribosome quality control (RQC) complex YloA/Tae2 family protein